MNIICYACNKKITKPGGLIFSPPDEFDYCQKTHVCAKCYKNLYVDIKK